MGPNSDAKIEMVKTISPTDVFQTEKFFSKAGNLSKFSNSIFINQLEYHKKPLFCMSRLLDLWNLNFTSRIVENYSDKNLNRIQLLFNNELAKIENIEQKQIFKDVFDSMKFSISELKFDDIAIETNESDSLKFTLVFSDNKTLMVTKSTEIENEFNDDNLIFFTLFVNNKMLVSDYSDFSTFIDGFQKYLAL